MIYRFNCGCIGLLPKDKDTHPFIVKQCETFGESKFLLEPNSVLLAPPPKPLTPEEVELLFMELAAERIEQISSNAKALLNVEALLAQNLAISQIHQKYIPTNHTGTTEGW